MQYAMLTLSAILLAVDFSLNKIYQKIKGVSLKSGFAFNSLLGLFTAIIFFIINGFKVNFSIYSFIMAALMSSFAMIYNLLGFRILKSGSMALYTLFLMSGGMTMPYIFGLLFLDEPFSLVKTFALLFILAGVVLSNFSGEKANFKKIGMCVLVFILNGLVSIVSKLHQIEINFVTVNATEFIIFTGIFKFIIAGILYLSLKNKREEKNEKVSFSFPLLIILLSAAVSGISYLMQLWGAVSLPATVLYPFITGGSIVFSSIAGIIFFKEKVSKKLVLSIILCFAGTILFL